MDHVWLLFTSYEGAGQNLEGIFVTERKAERFIDRIGPAPADAEYLIERWPLNPRAPRRGLDVSGFTDVTNVDTPHGHREFKDDRGVVIVVPTGIQLVGEEQAE